MMKVVAFATTFDITLRVTAHLTSGISIESQSRRDSVEISVYVTFEHSTHENITELFRASINAGSRLLVAAIAFLAFAFHVGAAEPNEAAFRKAFRTQDRNAGLLMAIRGVVGVGTGLDADGDIAIKVYTKRRNVGVVPR